MIRSRLRRRALSLFVVALSLMAISAGTAQAETGANWRVSGSNVTSLSPALQISEIETEITSLLTTVAAAKVEISCTGEALIGAKLEANGAITPGFKIKLTGCSTIINGSFSSICPVFSAGQSLGTVLSNELKGLIVLHNGEGLIRIEPKTAGGAIMQYQFHFACPLPSFDLKGTLFFRESGKALGTELVSHLFDQGPLTHLFVISDTPEHAANIDGSFRAVLTGAHAGLKWSGLPA